MRKEIKSLSFENLSIGSGESMILKECSFDFPLHSKTRIVFHSDKEKFMFFQALTQVEGIEEGKYLINGEDVSQFSFEEFLPYRLNIGFGFAAKGLIHNRTLRQNLELPLGFHKVMGPGQAREWVNYLCEYFGIQDEIENRPADAPLGVQKVTLILRAFVSKPELIILDSPGVLLSKKLHANLLQLIEDQMKNHGLKHLLFSTNDEGLSDCIADKNIILNKQKLKLVTPFSDQKVAS